MHFRLDQIWFILEFMVGPLLVQVGLDLVQGGPLLVQTWVSSTVNFFGSIGSPKGANAAIFVRKGL